MMALSFIEPELWAIKVYIAGIGILDVSAPVTLTLTLTRWALYTNLTRIAWRYTGCANMNFLRQGVSQLSSDRQTYIHRPTYRQTESTKIINHAATRVVNKKTHTGFRLVPKSITLNDPERRNDARYLCSSWAACLKTIPRRTWVVAVAQWCACAARTSSSS